MDQSVSKEPKFRRRAEARPDEVLDAALALFARQGFAHTTVEQVARAAGLSKAAVYLYFPSKKSLLAGLVRRAVRPVAEAALGQMAEYRGDPRPMIALALKMVAGRMADPAVFAVPGIVLREAAVAPEMALVYREEVLERVLLALRGLIAQGVAGGHIRAVDPDLTLRSIMGPVLMHLVLAEVFGIAPEGGLGLERLIDNHLTILFAGLEPEKEAR
jgi:AcrR family transcriptional regulator